LGIIFSILTDGAGIPHIERATIPLKRSSPIIPHKARTKVIQISIYILIEEFYYELRRISRG
jgi:hypothetical protein